MYPPLFCKTFFASLARKLSDLAETHNNEFCQFIFGEAGASLAHHIVAMKKKIYGQIVKNILEDPDLTSNSSDHNPTIDIVCEGSVWNSYNLLKRGFISELAKNYSNISFQLLKTRTSACIGAARLAAEDLDADIELKLNFSEHSELLDLIAL